MLHIILLIFLGFAGFFLAFYIHHKKMRHEHLVCPLRAHCQSVIHSQFSKFFGIPIEKLGMLYFASISIGYAALVATHFQFPIMHYALFAASLAAFLFSCYLTFIQVATLKQLCTWCLVSATISTLIFALTFATTLSPEYGWIFVDGLMAGLSGSRDVILAIHVFAMAIGLGSATITDLFFFKFLKDYRISHEESDVLNMISQVIWFAIGLAVITGVGVFLPNAQAYLENPKFILKVIVVGVIILNGALLNLYLAPKLLKITFHEEPKHKDGVLVRARRLAFVLGPVSIVSWYSAFVLGMLDRSPIDFGPLLAIYLMLLMIGIGAGQLVHEHLVKKSKSRN